MNLRQKIVRKKRFLPILITTITLCVAVACFAGEVNSIKVREKTIRIGDTADKAFAVLKKSDMVSQTIEKDPNIPDSLLVVKNFRVKGRKITIHFTRAHEPGPYKVTKIIEE